MAELPLTLRISTPKTKHVRITKEYIPGLGVSGICEVSVQIPEGEREISGNSVERVCDEDKGWVS